MYREFPSRIPCFGTSSSARPTFTLHQQHSNYFGLFRYIPVDTRRRFNVYKTSIRRRRRRIDVL